MYIKKYIFLYLIISISSVLQAATLEELTGFEGKNVNFTKQKNAPAYREDTFNIKAPPTGVYTKHQSITGVDFHGRTSSFIGTSGFEGQRACDTTSPERFIDHEIKLLEHDVLRYIDFWGEDTNASEDFRLILYKQCMPYLSAGPLYTEVFLSSVITQNSANFFSGNFINKGISSIKSHCKVMVRVAFTSASCAVAQNMRVLKVRAEIRRNDLIFIDALEQF